MTILWCGGEDIDFPNGTVPTPSTAGGNFRSSFSRCGLYGNTNLVIGRSLSFAGGAITSGWLHFQMNVAGFTNDLAAGFALNSAGNVGLFFGTSTSSSTKAALFKFDGTTRTQLAAETGNSVPNGTLCAVDMQLTSYGASSTVNIYINGTLALTYSGTTAVTGMANIDCAAIFGTGGTFCFSSEIIVADADTRGMGLLTMAPSAAGDVNNWTNAYTNINPVTINDSNVIYVNTTGQDFEANLTDLPAGAFAVLAIKAVARAEVTAGAVPTGVKLGVKTGGTINVGSAQTLTSSFLPYERLMTTNPVTSIAWSSSDMNALQLDLQSA